MLFNSLQFALFFSVVVFLFRTLPRSWRNPLLLGASIAFYTAWIPSYLLLLAVDIGVNYWLLRAIARSSRPRLFLTLSMVFTLGLLAYFKYAALAVEAMLPILSRGLGVQVSVPDIFLPLGISFYSFQILALAIDTYRREAGETPSFPRYALFVSFFPQLIAGPILRGHQFLPQLARGGDPTPERTRRGLWLLACGIGKKVIVADFLLAGYVDSIFGAPGAASAPAHLLAIYSFAFQIYFDFSGYTDMARGMALLLGFELPFNFMEPYLSRNPMEFWRRWHMTLSGWLRDYLYIPLGGNRRGSGRTYFNVLVTMLLGGLWHGAGWNFAVWGGLHGLLLIAHRLRGRARDETPLSLRDAPRIFLCFHAVCALWVFFRVTTFADASGIFEALTTRSYLVAWPVLQTLIVLLCIGLHVLERVVRLHLPEIQRWLAGVWYGAAIEGAALGTTLALALAFAGAGGEFIYFQF